MRTKKSKLRLALLGFFIIAGSIFIGLLFHEAYHAILYPKYTKAVCAMFGSSDNIFQVVRQGCNDLTCPSENEEAVAYGITFTVSISSLLIGAKYLLWRELNEAW